MTILAGDLGGTKTLLAIYKSDNSLEKIYQQKYLSNQWNSFSEMLDEFLSNAPKNIERPSFGCLAIAGRVTKGKSIITNLSWEIDQNEICSRANLKELEIINDFSVLIFGLAYLRDSQYVKINQFKYQENKAGLVAIIGAGTGLGIARGLIINDEIIALPSEGGHREFAPRNEEEFELAKWIKKELRINRLSVERIVSGTGLGYIASWLLERASVDFHPLKEISRTWISSQGTSSDLPSLASKEAEKGDSLMKEALRIWLSNYGSAVGDLALQELCNGGLWIAGGTASKNIEGIRSKVFLEAMYNKGRFREYIKSLPLNVLIDPEAGLFSAACRAQGMIKSNGTLTRSGGM